MASLAEVSDPEEAVDLLREEDPYLCGKMKEYGQAVYDAVRRLEEEGRSYFSASYLRKHQLEEGDVPSSDVGNLLKGFHRLGAYECWNPESGKRKQYMSSTIDFSRFEAIMSFLDDEEGPE